MWCQKSFNWDLKIDIDVMLSIGLKSLRQTPASTILFCFLIRESFWSFVADQRRGNLQRISRCVRGLRTVDRIISDVNNSGRDSERRCRSKYRTEGERPAWPTGPALAARVPPSQEESGVPAASASSLFEILIAGSKPHYGDPTRANTRIRRH